MIARYMGTSKQESAGPLEPQELKKATFFVFASCDGPLHVDDQGTPSPWHIQSPSVSFGPLVVGPPRERGDIRPLNTEGDDIETVQTVLTKIVLDIHNKACPSCNKSPTISSLIMQQ